MKLSSLLLLTTVFLSQIVFARARIPIPYGESEEIIKIVDLPDNENFQLDDGTYFDIGSKYTISHILWLAYSNTEPEIVGYVDGDEETYIEFTPEELKQIAEMAEIEIT